jgi:hypothetical protein
LGQIKYINWVQSQELDACLPYSKVTHYQLSNGAPKHAFL